jgi:hypothetical protein
MIVVINNKLKHLLSPEKDTEYYSDETTFLFHKKKQLNPAIRRKARKGADVASTGNTEKNCRGNSRWGCERKRKIERRAIVLAGRRASGRWQKKGKGRAGRTLRICALPMGLDFFSMVVYRLQKGRLGSTATRGATGGATFKT